MVKNAAVAHKIVERDFPTRQRAAMDLADFGDPEKRAFPVLSQHDLENAARLLGHASNPDAVKKRLIAIAKRKGLNLPVAWQEDEAKKPKEAATPMSTSTFKPKSRLARVKVYWLEDDAISLNGRKYPREAVNRLIQSAQVHLSDPDSPPLTCYLSHDEADRDATLALAGKVTDVGRENTKAYAWLDIPDTATGRDAATLVAGQYIRTMSLRASGAEMRMDSESAFPLVGGSNLKLEGIDFTSSPGLPQVARISDIVTESHEPQAINELFHARPSALIIEQEEDTMDQAITEEQVDPMASGTTKGISDMGDPHDKYSKRQYEVPNVQMNGEAHIDQQIHDHISGAMNLECSTMTHAESLRARASLLEAGAKFNKTAKMHLMAAHDAVASKLGVECASGGTGKMADDGMQDGDDDDKKMEHYDATALITTLREALTPSQKARQEAPAPAKEIKPKMTPQEAAQLLAEAGYSVQPPKTKEEQLQEQLATMQAEFDRKLAEQLAASKQEQVEAFKQAIAESKLPAPPPQRRSLVESTPSRQRPYYRNGDYLREKMQSMDFERLLDRSAPMPEGIDPERLLRELYPATRELTPDEWNRGKVF